LTIPDKRWGTKKKRSIHYNKPEKRIQKRKMKGGVLPEEIWEAGKPRKGEIKRRKKSTKGTGEDR